MLENIFNKFKKQPESNTIVRLDYSSIFKIDENCIKMTPCGFLKLPVRVSRIGVMVYIDEKGKEYNEFKPPEELFNDTTMESLKHVPLTDKHPRSALVDTGNCQKLSVGFSCGEPHIDQDYYLSCEVILTHKPVIERILKKFKNGESQQVSAGYTSEILEQKGTWNDEDYITVQTAVIFNHIALVEVGRAGPEVRLVFNEKETNPSNFKNTLHSKVFV